MYQTSFFPLRTIVGNPIPITPKPPVQVIAESRVSKELRVEYVAELKGSLEATEMNPRYLRYLPELVIEGDDIGLGPPRKYLPVPPLPPVDPSAPVLSLFALSEAVRHEEVTRQLSVTFRIPLAKPALVGGICYGGYPYLPYCITNGGENSSNFGLPREIRLTCHGTSSDESGEHPNYNFLDFETAITNQNIISHSGFHFLCTDPTYTDNLTLRLSDFPIILTRHTISKGDELEHHFVEKYGFIIPYFYIFEYQERTRYSPIVRGGLLGARLNHDGGEDRTQDKETCSYAVEYTHITPDPVRRYHDFTAASVFGQQRQYLVNDERVGRRLLEECFVSDLVPPKSNVTLHLQQSEEYERCIAGIKLQLPFVPKENFRSDPRIEKLFPRGLTEIELLAEMPRDRLKLYINEEFQIPYDVRICEKIGIRIHELDPSDGMSPMMVPLDGEYSTLLADIKVDEFSESLLTWMAEGIRFVRPSHAKYFAVEFTNLDEAPAQFVVKHLDLIQSAHVSIHPKASRTQQVRALNFRLVGANLADDYALLGDKGFNFNIERLVAGERKGVLYRANSLLDLLQLGTVRTFSNGRRRAVEFEKSEYGPEVNRIAGEVRDNFEARYSESKQIGWRRSETGSGVIGKDTWNRAGYNSPRSDGKEFEVMGNQETRTHNELLFPNAELSFDPEDKPSEWLPTSIYLNALQLISGTGNLTEGVINAIQNQTLSEISTSLIVPYDYDAVEVLEKDFDPAWRGTDLPKITGLKNVSHSPFGPIAFLGGGASDLIQSVWGFINLASQFLNQENLDPNVLDTFGNFIDLLINAGLVATTQGGILLVPAMSGTTLSGSVQPGGLGLTFGGSPLLPSLMSNTTFGSQGSISKQASKTGYSYAQYLNNSFDESNIETKLQKGEMKRKVTRREYPGTDNQRIKGAEVMWQGELVDIITGSIPLDFTLPATAGKMHYRTADESLRVRLGSGIGKSITVDFWFDLIEEVVRDDY